MRISWRDFALLYGPYAIYGLIIVLGAIYALGYRNGMASLLAVSGRSSSEAKCGA